jgi:hypothetical protein
VFRNKTTLTSAGKRGIMSPEMVRIAQFRIRVGKIARGRVELFAELTDKNNEALAAIAEGVLEEGCSLTVCNLDNAFNVRID